MCNLDISKVNVFSNFCGSQYSLSHNILTGLPGLLISK